MQAAAHVNCQTICWRGTLPKENTVDIALGWGDCVAGWSVAGATGQVHLLASMETGKFAFSKIEPVVYRLGASQVLPRSASETVSLRWYDRRVLASVETSRQVKTQKWI